MDDFETPFDDFPFLQGVDLTLWVQVLVSLVLLALVGLLAVGLVG
ncbi:MAG TPA: hypothetical protein VL281_11635 [Mycobacteriales bacterium]|jgi:hypothetical protein|nr:hypothetical protein [Mycobacteriales bacterium]